MVRRGRGPFLECSSAGEKRLSAFHARIKSRGGRSIEDIYQSAKIFPDGRRGLSWREAKGKRPINVSETRALYAQLWDEYIEENPHLLDIIKAATGLSDRYGSESSACQAAELWRIRCAALGCSENNT